MNIETKLSAREKGNKAEWRIGFHLNDLAPAITSVTQIPNQNDPNHCDLHVALGPGREWFFVQAKFTTDPSPYISIEHLLDWHRSTCPTVPMWWDAQRKLVTWADPTIALFRARTNGRSMVSFQRKPLGRLGEASTDVFLKWIKTQCKYWNALRSNDAWAYDAHYPIHFIDAVEDPLILLFLPVHTGIIKQLTHFLGRKAPRKLDLARAALAASRSSLDDPAAAVSHLLKHLALSQEDRDLRRNLEELFRKWYNRVSAETAASSAEAVCGLERLSGILEYQKPGDIVLPKFSARHSYPMGRIATLLPADLLTPSLLRILERETNQQVLLYAAWCLGILNHPSNEDLLTEVEKIRKRIRRRVKEPKFSGAVERQLLYTEAQLGSECACQNFIGNLSDPGVSFFEAQYNLFYYGNDWHLIMKRFERAFEDSRRTDVRVRRILDGIYRSLLRHKEKLNVGDSRKKR